MSMDKKWNGFEISAQHRAEISVCSESDQSIKPNLTRPVTGFASAGLGLNRGRLAPKPCLLRDVEISTVFKKQVRLARIYVVRWRRAGAQKMQALKNLVRERLEAVSMCSANVCRVRSWEFCPRRAESRLPMGSRPCPRRRRRRPPLYC